MDQPELPLTGRHAELDRLDQLFAQTVAGSGGAVLIVGEAGVGKSRLLLEARRLGQASHTAGGRRPRLRGRWSLPPFGSRAVARLGVGSRRSSPAKSPRSPAGTVPPRLAAVGITAREVEVLDLLADGQTNAQIASRLVLSVRTVETHVSSLLAKSGVSSRSELRTWRDLQHS